MSAGHRRLVGRRRFLVQAGRGALGVAVLGLAGCSGSGETGDGTGPASNPSFTEDPAAARATVRELARLQPRTILVGHGDPIRRDAADALARLAASLG